MADNRNCNLLALLVLLSASMMLSGFALPVYDEALECWNRLECRTGSHSNVRTEIEGLNYEPPAVPFDTQFAGDTFRDYQRKQQRLSQKIMDLSSVERHMLLGWLTDTFSFPTHSYLHHAHRI